MTTMRRLTFTLQACGALLLALGVIMWTGVWEWLVVIHVAVGIVLVLMLWTIATVAARAGVSPRSVWAAGAWGVLVVWLGLAQEDLLSGSFHWVIQVLHLAISMGAILWGRQLLRLVAQLRTDDSRQLAGLASSPRAGPIRR